MKRTVPEFRSLKRKLLLRALVVGTTLCVAALWFINTKSQQQRQESLRQRAEFVSNLAAHAAQGSVEDGDLHRIVAGIAAETGVLEVDIAGGYPRRMLASTKSEWVGKSLSELPRGDVGGDLDRAINTRLPNSNYNVREHLYDRTAPVLFGQLAAAIGATDGAVMVRLDGRPGVAAMWRDILELSTLFALGLSLLATFGYWWLVRSVVWPMAKIAELVKHHGDGDDMDWAVSEDDDEIGALARRVHASLRHTNAAIRALASQKIAVDEHSIIAVTDTRGTITYANDKFSAVSKYSHAELIGKNHRLINSGHHSKEFMAELWNTINSGQVWHGDLKNRAKDGTCYWVDTTIVPMLGADGKIAQFIAVRTDITERKAAEESVRRSETKFRTLFDSTSDAVMLLDETGFLDCNKATLEVFGCASREAFCAKQPGDLSPLRQPNGRDSHGLCSEKIASAIAAGSERFEWVHQRADTGLLFPCEVLLSAMQVDGRTVVQAAVRDITERRQSEEKLRQSEQRQSVALAGADLGLWDWDVPSGHVVFDARWCAMLGYQTHELEPTVSSWLSLLHPEDAPAVQALLEPHLRGETPVYEAEFRMRHADGHWVWILARGKLVECDNAGAPRRMAGTHMDITAHKQAEAALVAATDAANAATHAKSAFLASMSHEIRTPMNGLLGFTRLLMDTPLNEEQRGFATIIKHSGDALLTIINDILDFSKIEAGKLTFEALAFDVAKMLHEVSSLMAAPALEKRLALVVDYPSALTREIVGDSGRMRQVLLNFVSNAIKFTERGSVTIRATEVTECGARFLRLEVIDTGIGVAKDKHATLFQEFTQADSSTTRRYGGTGLGLAISKRLIEMMGGQVGMESEPGVGSTFWCTLPMVVVPAAAPAADRTLVPLSADQAALAPTSLNLRVLVAEDGPVNQLFVMRVLENFGCQADLAVNGREAMTLIAAGSYDVILMDCHMPEVDGFEATAAIRALEQNAGTGARIPIIALTASATPEDRDLCLRAGMDDFCTKPFAPEDLWAILERWSSAGRQASECSTSAERAA